MVFGLIFAATILALVGGYFSIVLLWSGADHRQYDLPRPKLLSNAKEPSAAHRAIVSDILAERQNAPKVSQAEALEMMRVQLDARGEAFEIDAEIRTVDLPGVKGEWVIDRAANPNRRILYFHGGGYMIGSPKSHRLITSKLSKFTGAAVFASKFRLLPQHSRMEMIEDARTAYNWAIANGPDGAVEADKLIIAGDSSGGNLALSTIAWARDEGLRAADAVYVMSPQTDLTLSSPSLISNMESDVMQGASFGPIVKAPKGFRLLFSNGMHGIAPNNPIVSPLLGDLSNLPPTLIQASNAEMFLDDAVRYANKANEAGSHVTLQVWPHMMHVWQAFEVPEADEAFEEAGAFLTDFLD